jgi:hypothetical protein
VKDINAQFSAQDSVDDWRSEVVKQTLQHSVGFLLVLALKKLLSKRFASSAESKASYPHDQELDTP